METKIHAMIMDSFQETMGVELQDREKNFITLINENKRNIVDLLYVFVDLEDKLQLPISKVLEERDYTVLSANGLVKAIIEDFGEYKLATNITRREKDEET